MVVCSLILARACAHVRHVVEYGCYKIHIRITNSLEQTASLEANRSSAIQEILRILCNLKVLCRIQKSPPSVLILSQINPVPAPLFHFLKIHLNIDLPSPSRSSKWPPSLRFLHQTPVSTYPFPRMCHMHRMSHSQFDHPNYIW